MRGTLAWISAAVLAALAGAGTTHGATATSTWDGVSYVAAPGERNDVTLTVLFDERAHEVTVTISDAGATISAGADCAAVMPNEVVCTLPPPVGTFMRLKDGDDSVAVVSSVDFGDCATTIRGGAGDDTLTGGESDDCLLGGSGDDLLRGGRSTPWQHNWAVETLYGGPGKDALLGGPGGDVLVGGPDGDVIRGGGGGDFVSYAASKEPVRVDLDGSADDGARGERDLVTRDVEGIIGGREADVLVGNQARNRISGRGGRDIIRGRGERDLLMGDNGADDVGGGAGNDHVVGGEYFERFGTYYERRPRPDRVRGGAGDDLVASLDRGRDYVVDGGLGIDRALVDRDLDPVRRVESIRALPPAGRATAPSRG